MNCNENNTLKEAYVDGMLSTDVRARVAGHLAGCAACRQRVDLARTLRQDLGGALKGALGHPRLTAARRTGLQGRISAGLAGGPDHAVISPRRIAVGLAALLLLGGGALVNAADPDAFQRLFAPPALPVPRGVVPTPAPSPTVPQAVFLPQAEDVAQVEPSTTPPARTTETPRPAQSATPRPEGTATHEPTRTPRPKDTRTPHPEVTATRHPEVTTTRHPEITATVTATHRPEITVTPTPAHAPTGTPTPAHELTGTPTPWDRETPTPTPAHDLTATPTPWDHETATPTPAHEVTATPTPRDRVTATPTPARE
jgi:hypothetical protein